MDLFERRIKSERKFSGKIIQLRYDTVELPDGRISHREVVEHPGGVGIVPVTSDKKILLVKQFRAGPQEPLLEIPAGKLEAGEDPKVCGMRELEEETGFRCGNCKLLSVFYSSPGFTDEKIYVYLATELQKCGQKLDEGEFLNVEAFDMDGLLNMIEKQQIHDAKTIIGILLAKNHLLSH